MQASTNPLRSQIRPHTALQAAALRRKHPNKVLDPRNRVRPRSDRRWRRDDDGGRPRMTAHALLDALQWWWVRRGAPWEMKDSTLLAEVKARCWHISELRGLRFDRTPSWLRALLPGRVSSGCKEFVAGVLAAHRSAAPGVLASFTELAAHYGVATRTVQRWVKRLEADEVLEVLKTWKPKPGDTRRGYWKHVYRPGPALAREAGLGILEGAVGLRPTTSQRATYHARRARRRHRERTRAEQDSRWRAIEAARGRPSRHRLCGACRKGCAGHAPPAASSLSLDTLTTPTSSYEHGVSTPTPPGPLTEQPLAARGEERPHTAAPSSQPRRSNTRHLPRRPPPPPPPTDREASRHCNPDASPPSAAPPDLDDLGPAQRRIVREARARLEGEDPPEGGLRAMLEWLAKAGR